MCCLYFVNYFETNSFFIKFIKSKYSILYLPSTFAKCLNSTEIYAFGLNNYEQLAVTKHEDLYFTPKLTSISNVQLISGNVQAAL